MAGIGFELRKYLQRETLTGLLQAYGFAAVLGSGPWVLSIFAILATGVLATQVLGASHAVVAFLCSVTYLMAASLILTGGLQLMFTRYIADRLFEHKDETILPNLIGALLLTMGASGLSGMTVLLLAFQGTSLGYRALMLANFVVLSDVWIVSVFLSGMKAYRAILACFTFGYGVTIISALALSANGTVGLLGGFFAGHATLLFLMLALVLRDYPGPRLVAFDFLRRGRVFPVLVAIGFFYNFGIWIDKFLFWSNPSTSEPVIGPLRYSPLYDLPIFLAYLSAIPGMAVFLVRIETDFAELYDAFYTAVREGDTLDRIQRLKDEMVIVLQHGLFEMFKIQGLTAVILCFIGPHLLRLAGIPATYVALFKVDVAGVSVQVLLLSILTVLYYLDLRRVALAISFAMAALNFGLTSAAMALGPRYSGFGFAVAMAACSVAGLSVLSRKIERLEFETFMLQR